MQTLLTYIRNPELLDAAAVAEIGELVEQYPAFQAARLLYLRGLYQLQDERFGKELSRAAICMPDRQRLFELFETEVIQAAIAADTPPSALQAQPEVKTTDRTLSLIDTFLGKHPQQQPKARRPRPAEAAVDYTAYLLQLDDAQPDDAMAADSAVSASDEPDSKAATSVAPSTAQQQSNETEAEGTVDDADDNDGQNDTSDTYFTETLARIYIKQGKYAKAIEIIRRISLLYPQKNRYFADQIRFLEKLLLNESYNPQTDEAE